VPAPAALSRLTALQYRNAVRDLFDGLELMTELEADTLLEGFTRIGASQLTVAPTTAEKYEAAALELSGRVFDDVALRQQLVGCAPASADDTCALGFITSFGRRAFRRPLSPEELAQLSGLARTVQDLFGDPWQGLKYSVAALLQSPHFVFRVDRGEPAPNRPGSLRYGPWEMASRLAFALWDTTPDSELLDAAERGELLDAASLQLQAERLAASPRFRPTLKGFFVEDLALDRLGALSKDATVFPQMSETLPSSMLGEIERLFEHVVFDQDADFRELFSSRTSFVNAELARLYGVAAPGASDAALDHFVAIPSPLPRAGLLGAAGVLAVHATPTATSSTLRGKFIRTRLLCQDIPPPPPGTVTELPPRKPGQTQRQRVVVHLSNPVCATCHKLMDPLGLALENFDGIGAYRDLDQGQPIDASGELDGVAFNGPLELADLIRNNPSAADCIVRQLYRFLLGHHDTEGEAPLLSALGANFASQDYRLRPLAVEIVKSDGFRYASAPTP
jgi:hypothetical protein